MQQLTGRWWIGFVFLLIISSCNGIEKVFHNKTPHEKYVEHLLNSGLEETLLGRQWISAGENSLRDSLLVNLPFHESGYFRSDLPEAKVFNFKANEGAIIQVNLGFSGDSLANIFLDLYRRKKNWQAEHIFSAENHGNKFHYEIRNTGIYSLRIHPELLVKGYFDLTLTTSPVYGFPVLGKDNQAIGSFFGASRDGGKRKHEGVDIFAKKGTPVLAVTNGNISRVYEKGIGGKVVWQWDNQRNINVYYAHLDSQLVAPGQFIQIGDTIGLVGNTGNAIRTPPHLHFGIYKRGFGAQDPYPFLYQPELVHTDISDQKGFLDSWKIVNAKLANVRNSPHVKSEIVSKLEKDTPIYIIGATKDWYRITLPNRSIGYIHKTLTNEMKNPIATFEVKQKTVVLENIMDYKSTIGFLEPNLLIPVLGKFLNYYLISYNGVEGWISGL